jgi:predicted O-methyltransferase YrrM
VIPLHLILRPFIILLEEYDERRTENRERRMQRANHEAPMILSALNSPRLDPTPIFEAFRGAYATELLTAAVAHFNLFGRLAQAPRTLPELGGDLGLADRPINVLVTALRAFGLVRINDHGQLTLTDLAREHLLPGAPFDVGDYVGLAADSPGVRAMVERLRNNRPAGTADDAVGTAFIYREGIASAMEKADSARHFTLALAGRGKNVAPILAEKVPLAGARRLVDVGGGTGIYSIALLRKNPDLRAVVLDRPEVLKVAEEMAQAYGVADRLACQAGDMFQGGLPKADVVLLSNVLHDWDVLECRTLIRRCAGALASGGRLLIHDVFLSDALDGPLPIALYSAALFCLTEGRAYSAAEYRDWLTDAGLTPEAVVPTLIHCGVLPATKK